MTRPREGPSGAFELGQYGVGRSAGLVFRGSRNGWESWLCDGQRCDRLGPHYNLPLGESACVCVRPPFRGAAHLVLEWMRGRELPDLMRDFEFVGGYPAGIVLRPVVVSPSPVLRAPDAEPDAAAALLSRLFPSPAHLKLGRSAAEG